MATITPEVKKKITEIVENFNTKEFTQGKLKYIAEFEDKYIYLKVQETEHLSPVVRMEYNGDIKNLNFAIFKWSSESYDPDETFFPGAEEVNGTLEGAMKAGIKAYYS